MRGVRAKHFRCGLEWHGRATSLDTMAQMNQAFRNIVNMLHGCVDGWFATNNYEQQEQPPADPQQLTSAAAAQYFASEGEQVR